jgi:hypothetical protein
MKEEQMNDTAATEQTAAAPDADGWEWAIVEIFGHRRHVGKSREEERFGAKMIRIDVPKLGPGPDEVTWSTHYYGGASLFSYTPTDERTVMKYADRTRIAAIPFRDHSDDRFQHEDASFGAREDDLDNAEGA